MIVKYNSEFVYTLRAKTIGAKQIEGKRHCGQNASKARYITRTEYVTQ